MEPMRTDMVIGAPRHLAWDTLADLEGVSRWNPAIDAAECISDQRQGLGARRRCYMHPSGWMVESVTEWEPEQIIAFAIENAPPIETGLGRFVLSDDQAGTRLQATFDYEIRFGPLGPVIDRRVVHRHLSLAWIDGMDGLRRHLEDQASAHQPTPAEPNSRPIVASWYLPDDTLARPSSHIETDDDIPVAPRW